MSRARRAAERANRVLRLVHVLARRGALGQRNTVSARGLRGRLHVLVSLEQGHRAHRQRDFRWDAVAADARPLRKQHRGGAP